MLRELLPQDLKLEMDQLTPVRAIGAARFLASVVGEAHAKQMDTAKRTQWRAELRRNRSKSLDVPPMPRIIDFGLAKATGAEDR